jgi:hypothetical protein
MCSWIRVRLSNVVFAYFLSRTQVLMNNCLLNNKKIKNIFTWVKKLIFQRASIFSLPLASKRVAPPLTISSWFASPNQLKNGTMMEQDKLILRGVIVIKISFFYLFCGLCWLKKWWQIFHKEVFSTKNCDDKYSYKALSCWNGFKQRLRDIAILLLAYGLGSLLFWISN